MNFLEKKKKKNILSPFSTVFVWILPQVASLLHDDVLDDADTRRGIGSLNFVVGNKVNMYKLFSFTKLLSSADLNSLWHLLDASYFVCGFHEVIFLYSAVTCDAVSSVSRRFFALSGLCCPCFFEEHRGVWVFCACLI